MGDQRFSFLQDVLNFPLKLKVTFKIERVLLKTFLMDNGGYYRDAMNESCDFLLLILWSKILNFKILNFKILNLTTLTYSLLLTYPPFPYIGTQTKSKVLTPF